MATYTLTMSRNMSVVPGVSNGRPLGEVINIHPGDICSQWDGQPDSTKEIFYRVCMEMTEEQVNSLATSEDENPDKRLTLSTSIFTAGEITQLESRQVIVGNIGQTPVFSDLYFEDV